MKTRREKNSTPDTRNSPRHKWLYPTFLSSVLLTAALLALLHTTPPAAHAAPPPQDADATLRIINDSDQTICYVFISPVTSDEWGDDWLDENETIPPGESRAFDVAAGDYDVGLADCDGNILLAEQSLAIAGQHELLYVPEPEADSSCDALLQSGVTLYRQANYRDAVQKSQEALTCYQEIGDRQGEGNSLGVLGIAYESLGQYATAIEYYEQALAIARDIGDRQGEGSWLGNLGNAYHDLGQYATAIKYHEQALAIARDIGDRYTEGRVLGNLGNAYLLMGQYVTAIEYYVQALAISRDIGDRQGEGNALGNLGNAYEPLGQYATAIEYYVQALAIARDIGDRNMEGRVLGALGNAYLSMGQYATAIEYNEQALAIARDIGDRNMEGIVLGNLGNAYFSMGQYATAIEYYEQALAISRDIGARQGEGDHSGNLGSAYGSMGQYTTAIEYYEQAMVISRDIGDRQGEGSWLGNLGRTYLSMGQYATAIEYCEQALVISRDIGNRRNEGVWLGNLGSAYLLMGQYATAIEYYEQALAIARDIGDRQGEGRWLGNLGIAYRNLGQHATAIEYYERAIAVIETLRGELGGVGEFKSSFAAQYMSPYRGMITALVELSRFEEAFHYAQRAKARTFLDQMGNVRIDPRATDNPELVEQEQTLRAEIRALEAVLSGRSSFASLDTTRGGGPPPLSGEQQAEVQARLNEAYREYERLLAQIKLTNPEYASLRAVQASTLITVQQTLPPDVTLVEYYVLSDTQTLAFVVTPRQGSGQAQGSFHTEAISVTRDSLSLATSQFFTETQTTLSTVPASLQALYDALIAPIEPYLTSERIIIAPHDVLHYVPFAALHDGEQYLIEQHALVQLPSASVLPFILEKARRESSGGPPLILGDPDGSLRFGRQEAQAVAELYATTAHVGEAALEQLVWEQGPDAAILHLATHGAYNEHAPLFSRILLAADTEEEHDGVLEVHEVYNLDLSNADLVVLSACETRLGERSAGDEIVGLNRAFIYAGTPSVIATLWSVEDAATKDIMLAFYSYLNDENYTKGEALRQAQLDLLQNPATAHPYYWAAFVLTGDAGEPGPGTTETPTPSGEDDSNGGPCPSAALPLTLVAIVGTLVITRRNRVG